MGRGQNINISLMDDYEGFKIAGAAVVATGDEVIADHANLYKATLASGAVAIEKVGL